MGPLNSIYNWTYSPYIYNGVISPPVSAIHKSFILHPIIWFLVFKGPHRRSICPPPTKSLQKSVGSARKTTPSVNTFGCRTERFDWKSDMARRHGRYRGTPMYKQTPFRSKVETRFPVFFWKQNCRNAKRTFILDKNTIHVYGISYLATFYHEHPTKCRS